MLTKKQKEILPELIRFYSLSYNERLKEQEEKRKAELEVIAEQAFNEGEDCGYDSALFDLDRLIKDLINSGLEEAKSLIFLPELMRNHRKEDRKND